ncbi:MAG: hypothetical protein WBA64_14720 [Marinomonas sp.]|uniref:hypothetical protein n=1 Tax=Marinomonas sp. TaxID=1904862 RepID=UPI003C78F069
MRLPDCFIIFWFVALVCSESLEKDEGTSIGIHPVLRQHRLVKALLSVPDSRRASVHTDLR